MIAGDLGRFGSGGPYEEYSQFYEKKIHQHGQVKDHACIFICEFVKLTLLIFCEHLLFHIFCVLFLYFSTYKYTLGFFLFCFFSSVPL